MDIFDTSKVNVDSLYKQFLWVLMIVVSRLRLSIIDMELLSDNSLMASSTRKQLEKPQAKPLPLLAQPRELSRKLLPTKQDVLLFFFFKRDDEFVSNNKKKAYFNYVKREVIDLSPSSTLFLNQHQTWRISRSISRNCLTLISKLKCTLERSPPNSSKQTSFHSLTSCSASVTRPIPVSTMLEWYAAALFLSRECCRWNTASCWS